jgi:sugar phosphate permease
VGRKAFSITKAKVAAELGVSEGMLAAIDTGFLAAYACGQVPSGLAADRVGARKLIGGGMLLSAAACALFGSMHSGALLLACFALNGLAQATGWPGTTKVVAEWTTREERGRVMGWWSTCYQVGGIAASALATWLLGHYGWRSAFWVPAAWLGAVGVAVMGLLPRGEAGQSAEAAASTSTSTTTSTRVGRVVRSGRPAFWPSARELFVHPVLYSYGAGYFFIKLIRYSLLFWLPYYLHTAAGFDDVTSGYVSTSFEIGGVLGTIALGYISDRARGGRATSAVVSLLGLALALFLYARLGAASAAMHFASMMLIGALLFGPDALLSGAAAQDAGGARAAATAVGIVNGMGSAGALLQGPLTVAVKDAFGWNQWFYVFFVLALLASACLLPALRSRPQLA